MQIVEKDSATFEAPNTTNHLIDTDHSGLNKFRARNEEGYRKILQTLRFMIKGASQRRKETKGKEEHVYRVL